MWRIAPQPPSKNQNAKSGAAGLGRIVLKIAMPGMSVECRGYGGFLSRTRYIKNRAVGH